MQLRLETGLTSEDYVKQKAWQSATLAVCPVHEGEGKACSFARHTPYPRVEPAGVMVARYYCPEAHQTFSLLPDFLASRLSSTLEAVEGVVAKVEARVGSFEAQAQALRPDIGLQGAVRWVRRRVMGVVAALMAVKGLRPDVFAGKQPTLTDFRAALDGVEPLLPALRGVAGSQVRSVPCPVGLCPRPRGGGAGKGRRQHEAGADPPP